MIPTETVEVAFTRLIDQGLSGIAILGLIGLAWLLWNEVKKERTRNDTLNERRIDELKAANDTVSKAIKVLDTAIEQQLRSHAQ